MNCIQFVRSSVRARCSIPETMKVRAYLHSVTKRNDASALQDSPEEKGSGSAEVAEASQENLAGGSVAGEKASQEEEHARKPNHEVAKARSRPDLGSPDAMERLEQQATRPRVSASHRSGGSIADECDLLDVFYGVGTRDAMDAATAEAKAERKAAKAADEVAESKAAEDASMLAAARLRGVEAAHDRAAQFQSLGSKRRRLCPPKVWPDRGVKARLA